MPRELLRGEDKLKRGSTLKGKNLLSIDKSPFQKGINYVHESKLDVTNALPCQKCTKCLKLNNYWSDCKCVYFICVHALDWWSDSRFDSCRFHLYSFMEIDHEIFSMVISSLPLIQGGQLSVSGERICGERGLILSLPRAKCGWVKWPAGQALKCWLGYTCFSAKPG